MASLFSISSDLPLDLPQATRESFMLVCQDGSDDRRTGQPIASGFNSQALVSCETGTNQMASGLMTRFKIIKHSNHRGSRGEVVGQADCSNAVADYCTKTGTHRLSGRDRAGRKWSIEIGLDLFEQMQLNSALRDR
jgi:hypothetical protein